MHQGRWEGTARRGGEPGIHDVLLFQALPTNGTLATEDVAWQSTRRASPSRPPRPPSRPCLYQHNMPPHKPTQQQGLCLPPLVVSPRPRFTYIGGGLLPQLCQHLLRVQVLLGADVHQALALTRGLGGVNGGVFVLCVLGGREAEEGRQVGREAATKCQQW
jgi:hypothetical protein